MAFTEPKTDWEKYEKTRDSLWTGNFTGVEMDVNKWINEHEWNYLRCAAHGCLVNGSTDMLYLLFLSVNQRMLNPSASSYTDTKDLKQALVNTGKYWGDIEKRTHEEVAAQLNYNIIEGCEIAMKQIIWSSVDLQDNDKRGTEILDKLSRSGNRNCRLYCCAAVNDPTRFLNDSDKRIRKIAKIRLDFAERWQSYSDDEKETVNFLTTALNTDMIVCSSFADGQKSEDVVFACFRSSLLIDHTKYHIEFDDDILRNIKDRRVLADSLFQMITENKMSFAEGMQPSSYERIVSDKTQNPSGVVKKVI